MSGKWKLPPIGTLHSGKAIEVTLRTRSVNHGHGARGLSRNRQSSVALRPAGIIGLSRSSDQIDLLSKKKAKIESKCGPELRVTIFASRPTWEAATPIPVS